MCDADAGVQRQPALLGHNRGFFQGNTGMVLTLAIIAVTCIVSFIAFKDGS